MLDMCRSIADKVFPVPPIRAEHTYLIVGAERTGQEALGVETLEPLAV